MGKSIPLNLPNEVVVDVEEIEDVVDIVEIVDLDVTLVDIDEASVLDVPIGVDVIDDVDLEDKLDGNTVGVLEVVFAKAVDSAPDIYKCI